MKIHELKNKNIVIWGAGCEGRAAARLIRAQLPEQEINFVDEGGATHDEYEVIHNPIAIEEALAGADVIIKSPGVSLYHPLLTKEKKRDVLVTSLLNIWCAENPKARIIAVTGTKGKSTTSALLQHVLEALGERSVLLGNIGIPVSEATQRDADYFIIEVSSYQAANFTGRGSIGVLTSLFPEHIDWHGSEETYYRDKANLLAHCAEQIVEAQACEKLGLSLNNCITFNSDLTTTKNAYLDRVHNRGNVNAVLAVIEKLALDKDKAIAAMKSFESLPHRQQEISEVDGILFVDDSISTTPQSAIAAMETYKNREIILIAGGHDRGVDFSPLSDYIIANKIRAVICIGENGPKLFDLLQGQGMQKLFKATSMKDAVDKAKACAIRGCVILLSPAASSYDMFKDYIARARAFIDNIG